MNLENNDTIAAIASGIGGAVAVIRISGPEAQHITDSLWEGKQSLVEAHPRVMYLGTLVDDTGEPVDQCLSAVFRAPKSFTGENMVELYVHGGPMVARSVLTQLLKAGARHAEAGEFTRRAFLNGKMDLTQAEAVADIVEAESEMAMHTANRQLQGRLKNRIEEAHDKLLFLLSETESRLDFPEEDLDWLPQESLLKEMDNCMEIVKSLAASRREGEILRNGVRLVLAGPANVGKSTLLNYILGRDRAIVTEIPGTTRDTLEETANIRGIPVHVIDTAGIRESEDFIEQTGVERSRERISQAQVLVWLVDINLPLEEQLPDVDQWDMPLILVANKIDQLAQDEDAEVEVSECQEMKYVSLKNEEGLAELFDAIERVVWQAPHGSEPEVAVNARHAALLDEGYNELAVARDEIQGENYELAGVPLRNSVDALGKILGRTASDDVLDTIFARFCIGK